MAQVATGVPSAVEAPGRPTTRPTNHTTTPTDHRPTIDLAPLTDLIDDLTRRNTDLAATAAMWQTRAAHLEDQIKQLATGETAPSTSSEALGSRRSDHQPSQGLCPPDMVAALVGRVSVSTGTPWYRAVY